MSIAWNLILQYALEAASLGWCLVVMPTDRFSPPTAYAILMALMFAAVAVGE